VRPSAFPNSGVLTQTLDFRGFLDRIRVGCFFKKPIPTVKSCNRYSAEWEASIEKNEESTASFQALMRNSGLTRANLADITLGTTRLEAIVFFDQSRTRHSSFCVTA
jgi:hypothetical protein